MSLQNQVIVIVLYFLLSFFFIRMFFTGMKCYQLNKNALKKRKKTENFIQWLLYTKFKEEIPFGWRIFYFIFCLIHLGSLISCLLIAAFDTNASFCVGRIIAISIYLYDTIWILIVFLLFKPRSPYQSLNYERWIKKKRGMKPKK